MTRAFLIVMDSAGIGGALDADAYFNDGLPDTGANTIGHIAQACAAGQAEEGRSGPLQMPHLDRLGLGAAINDRLSRAALRSCTSRCRSVSAAVCAGVGAGPVGGAAPIGGRAATSPRWCWMAGNGSRATCLSTAPVFARC